MRPPGETLPLSYPTAANRYLQHPAMSNPVSLDPANPGVGKQMMLDWLRIHYPKRVMQPHLFPPPKNPSLTKLGVTQSGSNAASSNSEADGSQPVTDCSGPGLQDQKSLVSETRRSRMPSKLVSAETVHLGKRSVSFEGKPQSKKRIAKGVRAVQPSIVHTLKQPKKQVVDDGGDAEAPKALEASASRILNISPYIPKSGKPYLNPKAFLDNNQNNLQLAHPTPPAKSNLEETYEKLIDVQSDVNVLPSTEAIESDRDLMTFSQGDVFKTENIMTGSEICPITNHGKQLTGVDVFLRERQQHNKLFALEETVAILTRKVDTAKKLASEVLAGQAKVKSQAQFATDSALHELQESMVFLEKKISAFDDVKDQVTSLQFEVSRLRARLDKAHDELQTQEEIITKLMSLQETSDNEESGDDEESDL
ncbi:uncharacterized protein MELLADRAFT_93101 [Melampsora larici-populina 98AG31]|uniref:Uncharacterized protein n=1 Tax=Melampsora larici-populina (strain 98AG31 / pathotype 3-4-7) TaxID=747676 RepID=F4S3Y4_MELLP|nr:uncharacterized protein MELLADRAFT_93101 [Melampsora larici-populina 98AG31]EGG00659.1 hypothetical protein MELLADRAFT_93101 [Melampsora larici-populina 98AG31]